MFLWKLENLTKLLLFFHHWDLGIHQVWFQAPSNTELACWPGVWSFVTARRKIINTECLLGVISPTQCQRSYTFLFITEVESLFYNFLQMVCRMISMQQINTILYSQHYYKLLQNKAFSWCSNISCISLRRVISVPPDPQDLCICSFSWVVVFLAWLILNFNRQLINFYFCHTSHLTHQFSQRAFMRP